AARHGRLVPVFAVAFALASLAIAVAGLSAGGVLAVQGFARTSVSLLQLLLWVVPLLALVLGAVAGADCRDLEFVAALPLARRSIVLARWVAWVVALGAALLLGLGLAGLAIGSLAGGADGLRYLALVGVALLLLAATLAIGLWVGVAAAARGRAIGVAILVWLVLVFGMDLAAITALAVLPPGEARWELVLLLLANPVDSARALGLGLFRADVIAGPTGAALRGVLGGWEAWLLVFGLATWTALPLSAAGRRFARSDL
ncbi:MAG: ABC transporter permease subunit, partial [Acidimicrobiales bacterium]